jgi:hypothetical protein
MDNIYNLLNQFVTPIDEERKLLFYRINQIHRERMVMYQSFIKVLYNNVKNTYLGDDYLDDVDKQKHFNWCWLKTVETFKDSKIYFFEFGELYDYFRIMFKNSFYNKEDVNTPDIIDFWLDMFDYDKNKTISELEDLIDMYRLFNKSFYV